MIINKFLEKSLFYLRERVSKASLADWALANEVFCWAVRRCPLAYWPPFRPGPAWAPHWRLPGSCATAAAAGWSWPRVPRAAAQWACPAAVDQTESRLFSPFWQCASPSRLYRSYCSDWQSGAPRRVDCVPRLQEESAIYYREISSILTYCKTSPTDNGALLVRHQRHSTAAHCLWSSGRILGSDWPRLICIWVPFVNRTLTS